MAVVPTTWLAPSADGRLEVFVVGSTRDAENYTLWHLYQTAPSGGWSQWVSHGYPVSPLPGYSTQTVTADSAGRLRLFLTDGTSTYDISQPAPNGGWTPAWTSHQHPPAVVVGSPTQIMDAEGFLQVFAIGADDTIWQIGQIGPSGDWSGWISFGAPAIHGGLRSAPTVAPSADGRLELFAIGGDGGLWHTWQKPGGGWSSWTPHGAPPGTSLDHQWQPVMSQNAEGRLELFALSDDGALWHIWQTAPSQGWSDWLSHGTPPGSTFNNGRPALALNADGRLELFVCSMDGQLWHFWQTAPGKGWSPWLSHGSPIHDPPTEVIVWGACALALNAEKRLELFVTASDGALWHIWQTAPGGGWSGFLSHGVPDGYFFFGV